MPKKVIDYSKTVIYKIVCNDLNVNDIYVGHTSDFIKRKYGHKNNCNNVSQKTAYNFKVYQTIRNNGGWDNWSMIEIEKYPCADGNEAAARERHWYEQLGSQLNVKVPNRSHKDWRTANDDYCKTKRKERYEKDKQNKCICECGGHYIRSNKNTHLKTKIHQNYFL
jgi:hypothetical protein